MLIKPNKMKIFNKLFLLGFGLISGITGFAQIVGGNGYIMGPTLEVGIHSQGFEGSSVTPPMANHNRGPGGRLGFVSNPLEDGWTNYDGDFYLPGSPENTFGIQIDGTDYQNSATGEYDIPMTGPGISNYEVLGKCKLLDWDGSIGGIDIHMTYKLDTTKTYYTVDVTLTNTNPVAKNNVYFYKTFDPDNNQPIGWGFVTTNEIEYQPSPFCPKSLVSARQINAWTSYVGLGAIDPNIHVSHGGFAVASGSDIYNGTGGLTGVEGAVATADAAISICHRDATIAAGASSNFQFVVILSSEQVEDAIQSLYFVDYDGADPDAACTEEMIDLDGDGDLEPVPDTIEFDCAGGPIELEFAGPYVGPAYDIVWYNEDTGEEVGEGASHTILPVGSTMYRVEADPVGDCFELPIERYFVILAVGDGPMIDITDIGPQCGAVDLEDLIIEDTMDIPGTDMTFHGSEPEAMDDYSDLWDGSPIGPGDEVWVMIADPDGSGCWDKKLIEIEYIEISAGEDSDGHELCNAGGATIIFEEFLVDTSLVAEGYVWEEVTPSGGAFDPISTEFDPTGIPAGDYTVRFIALSGPDCDNDTSFHTVTVYDQPTAGADNAGEICNAAGLEYDLNTLLSGHDAGGTWTEIDDTEGGFDAATGIFSIDGTLDPGDYTFEYTVEGTDPCIDDVAEFTITVVAAPAVDAGPDQFICIGEEVILAASGDPATYEWDPATVSDGVPFSPGVGTVTYTVTATNGIGCVNTDDVDVTVYALPVINFFGDSLGCTPFESEFTVYSDVAISSTDWYFGDGDSFLGATSPTVSHVYLFGEEEGYDVSITVTDINGCVNSLEKSNYVVVYDQPIAKFSMNPQSVYTNDTRVEFTNESMYATDYIWDFGDGSDLTNETNPEHFFPSDVGDILYPVQLKVSNAIGCEDSITKYMNVKGIILFYIPNAFTPDGDQFNEKFQPVFESGYDPYDFHMTIFNRYGEIVFESYDVTGGWNGTYGDGGLVDDGVYIWSLEFKELHTDKRHKHSGHVTVIK